MDGGFNPRLWPFILTVGFGIVFIAIADMAWLTAMGTTAPWFTSSTSAQMYTSTLTTATLATLILSSLAASRLASLEGKARAARREAEDSRDAVRIPVEEAEERPRNRPTSAGELDQILAELGQIAEAPTVEVRERSGRPMQVSVPRAIPGIGPSETDRRSDPMIGEALRRARRLIWQTVTGPLAVFLIFIGLSGAMLPGTSGFAQTHFELNTGFVLFLGYGWPFLVAWTIAAIVLLHGPLRIESFEPANIRALLPPRRAEASRYR